MLYGFGTQGSWRFSDEGGIPARADTGGRGAHYLLKKIDAGSCIEVILACVPKKSGVWNPKNSKNLIALQKTMCIFGVNSND